MSYDPNNHDFMVRTRQAKIDGITVPDLVVEDLTGDAKVLVLGWSSTCGPIGAAVRRARRAGYSVAHAHLRHLNPFPKNLGDVLAHYDKVVIPEMNLGQLALLIRGRYLVDAISVTQVRGMPFRAAELAEMLQGVLDTV
jgi:2-oxoglutarate ferredoxin oxidoreductase subunit alpha